MNGLRIAVFASGQGTNFQALVDAVRDQKLDVIIELLVCDKPSAPVVERAQRAGVDTFIFKPKDYPSREAYESEIAAELERRGVGLIVLAGYMRILTPVLVEPYYGRMINVHPSLLPAFPGVNGIGQAFEYGVKLTGVTVHYVDGGLDSGPIIAQRAVEVADEDTESSLAERIHETEQALLPWVVQQIANGRVRLDGRRVTIDFS
ncbi:phosphoribosylglycinamide formyltransferase [Paenibacillus curdlanolyticus YK9]|uniref:Phosphoribosylglycinamide formyltransferase n=1 Tax=Paenibacillus curdlanolyticus YK9 TaxID=717606 RepID=E0IAG6_9BACL|nr:phosphoribosylglycinamide formyltransferase [Paenibacillus curdlanolyticus]EFM10743.1 phosphoribosylglycinamide formyltransferase [Paenibacillus curdlanolyticus YK9]